MYPSQYMYHALLQKTSDGDNRKILDHPQNRGPQPKTKVHRHENESTKAIILGW